VDAQIGYPPVRLMSPPDMQCHLWLLGMRRAMELMLGMRAAIRAGTEIQALAFHQRPSLEYRQELRQGLTRALSKRDAPFGDYRTTSREETS
jgi:hypothetical protein